MTKPAWRQVQDIDEILPLLRQLIASNDSDDAVTGMRGRYYSAGYPEWALADAEEKLGKPIPADLRAFYSVCGGVSGTVMNPFDDSVFGLENVSWDHPYWLPRPEFPTENDHLDMTRLEGGLFFFGGDGCGSDVAYCESFQGRPASSIILLKHDADEIQFLADSFHQWLARFVASGGREYSLYPLSLFDLDETLELDFVRDHLRLNPESDWAVERIARIELEASGAEDCFHWWDAGARCLRPFAKLGDKEYVDQSQSRSRTLEPLALAKAGENLEHLDLSFSRVQDLTGVGALPSLELLYLNATPVTNLEPLAELVSLKRLDISDTRVSDLSPLQGLRRLWDLHLDNTQVEDLSPLKNLTALKYLSLRGVPVDDVTPLLGLRRLEDLTLDDGALSRAEIKSVKRINKNISVCVVGADGYTRGA